jgi:hypothetical protein
MIPVSTQQLSPSRIKTHDAARYPPENFPRRVSPHEVKHFFGQIYRDGVKLLRHGTRLLAVT